MKVILMKKVGQGKIGDVITVRPGFGRYLIPQGKALPANKKNLEIFAEKRAELEHKAHQELEAAANKAQVMQGLVVEVTARAAEEGKLFGSVGVVEIVRALEKAGHTVSKQEVFLPNPIRHIGEYDVELGFLHREILLKIKLKVVAE